MTHIQENYKFDVGVKGLKEQNVTKIDSKQNLMQILQGERKKLPKRLTKEFEHSKISHPL